MNKKEIIPLYKNKAYKNQTVSYICKKGFSTDDDKK